LSTPQHVIQLYVNYTFRKEIVSPTSEYVVLGHPKLHLDA